MTKRLTLHSDSMRSLEIAPKNKITEIKNNGEIQNLFTLKFGNR